MRTIMKKMILSMIFVLPFMGISMFGQEIVTASDEGSYEPSVEQVYHGHGGRGGYHHGGHYRGGYSYGYGYPYSYGYGYPYSYSYGYPYNYNYSYGYPYYYYQY